MALLVALALAVLFNVFNEDDAVAADLFVKGFYHNSVYPSLIDFVLFVYYA
jgi:hypothetical protein